MKYSSVIASYKYKKSYFAFYAIYWNKNLHGLAMGLYRKESISKGYVLVLNEIRYQER